jgi:hypothetical protein
MKTSRPSSAAHTLTCVFSVVMWAAGIYALRLWSVDGDPALNGVILMAFIAAGYLLPEIFFFRTWRRTLPRTEPQPGAGARVATKYVGLIASMGLVALAYWLFPEYKLVGFYNAYWSMLMVVLPAWLVAAPLYLWWADRRMTEPRDGLWHMGRLLSPRWREADPAAVRQHLLGWLVKGFFTPLMFTFMCHDLGSTLRVAVSDSWTFAKWYDLIFTSLFFLDTSLISVSYILSPRATGAHIRSTEPSMMGWLAALVCYQPIWAFVSAQYITYEGDMTWGAWLGPHELAYKVWGSCILALVGVFAWATISFGGKFSNMTHRGIITSGAYRWTKHPAYFSKNLSWWMISVPFLGALPWWAKLQHCLLLLALNGIYFLRAKTEERHLSLDPVYVEYARWIDGNGILRWMQHIPFLGALVRWQPKFSGPTDISPRAYGA